MQKIGGVVLPDHFERMGAWRNSAETQQLGHAPRSGQVIKDVKSSAKDGALERGLYRCGTKTGTDAGQRTGSSGCKVPYGKMLLVTVSLRKLNYAFLSDTAMRTLTIAAKVIILKAFTVSLALNSFDQVQCEVNAFFRPNLRNSNATIVASRKQSTLV